MTAPREPVVVTVGGATHRIRPLTFAQVEAIEGAVDAGRGNLAGARRIIVVGLSRDHREAAEAVERGDVETDAREIGAAMAAILRLGGFLPAGAGEAGAAAPNASAGTGSAPG